MLIARHTITTTASSEAVFTVWKDAEQWPAWDHELEAVKLQGPFKKGTTGKLKPRSGPWVSIMIAECTPGKSFLTTSKMPLCMFYHDHFIEVKSGTTHITHVIEMKGLLAFFFAFVIGRGMKKYLPIAMKNLVTLAESTSYGPKTR